LTIAPVTAPIPFAHSASRPATSADGVGLEVVKIKTGEGAHPWTLWRFGGDLEFTKACDRHSADTVPLRVLSAGKDHTSGEDVANVPTLTSLIDPRYVTSALEREYRDQRA
jgi:hypothetical protein